ncbi:hypothetical protein [Sporosarcina sp. P19]|uniref:hypothetical protein n=1 Tax=Sporosarcina sp. P19 TaxID=2048258 RepID=UPI00130465FC|nr:hypothetical protein [Sporosarcina sp. P19]
MNCPTLDATKATAVVGVARRQRQAHFPVCGSLRKPSTSAVVEAMNLPLTLPAKPQPPD